MVDPGVAVGFEHPPQDKLPDGDHEKDEAPLAPNTAGEPAHTVVPPLASTVGYGVMVTVAWVLQPLAPSVTV